MCWKSWSFFISLHLIQRLLHSIIFCMLHFKSSYAIFLIIKWSLRFMASINISFDWLLYAISTNSQFIFGFPFIQQIHFLEPWVRIVISSVNSPINLKSLFCRILGYSSTTKIINSNVTKFPTLVFLFPLFRWLFQNCLFCQNSQ